MNIAILDDYQRAATTLDCYAMLREHSVTVFSDTVKGTDALAARLQDTEALVLIRERSRISAELLARLPRLRLICQTGGSVHTIDVAECTRRNVVVTCARAETARYSWASSHASAELAWALVLAAMRRVVREAEALRTGRWQTGLGTTTRGRTLGIFGYGKIGAEVGRFGHCFGMRVKAWGRAGSLERARNDGVETAAHPRELFEQADVLSLHVTLNDETRGMVRKEDLLRMKPSSLLVNTSRAGVIESGALVAALREGRPGFAAVDVYEDEPLTDAAHPLLQMDNVLCTPHIGFVERDSYEESFGNCFAQINAFAAGSPIDVVNPEALGHKR